MTTVEKSPVQREVGTLRSGRLIVRMAPEGLWIREKGRRTAYLLPYGVAYTRAAMMAADADRRAKAAARKARKAAR